MRIATTTGPHTRSLQSFSFKTAFNDNGTGSQYVFDPALNKDGEGSFDPNVISPSGCNRKNCHRGFLSQDANCSDNSMHQLFFMMKMKMMPSHHDNKTVYDVGDVDDWDDQNAIRAVN